MDDAVLVSLTPSYSIAKSAMIDTRNFSADFTARLVAGLGDLDAKTDGVLFHGENFQALNLMQARYREKVKGVYIDPPYNTGVGDFAYKDCYQHSSWISMIHDRVQLSSFLLNDDGNAFVNIDDNEQANLRYILDQVLSPSSFLADAIWQKAYSPRMDAKQFSSDVDHILVYGAGVSRVTFEQNQQQFSATDPASGKQYRRRSWRKEGSGSNRADRPNLFYPIYAPDGTAVLPIKPDGSEGRWRGDLLRFEELTSGHFVEWINAESGWQVYIKQVFDPNATRPPSTLWRHEEAGHNHEAAEVIKSLFKENVFQNPKPPTLVSYVCQVGGIASRDIVLDYFAGSGTTGHAVINPNREDSGRRIFMLVEMADYFDTVLLPRLKKVNYTPEWKDGKPKRPATAEEIERGPRIYKIVRLESYEDTLNNLEVKRAAGQQALLDLAGSQGPDKLREQYLLQYMLRVETQGSPSLLSIATFTDPTAYQLIVKRPGSDESREMCVDLLETFNWLLGLTVEHIAAPQTFAAQFDRDREKRLGLKGRLKTDAAGPYWYRTVTGTSPDGRKTLVIWRKLTGNPEEDNLVLDEWFTRQGYSSKDSEFGLIYVNGGNNLENLKAPDDTWKVRLIEDDFHRLMFATEGK